MPTYKDEHSFTPLLFEDDNAKNNYFSTKHIFGGLFNKGKDCFIRPLIN